MIVYINDLKLNVRNWEKLSEKGKDNGKIIIRFLFDVSSEDYHRVTSELYKNKFRVKVPKEELDFPAMIHRYSTSITNLYVDGEVAEFKLELIEK